MRATRRNGVLVAIEGIDAAGKRTQTSLLVAWLRRMGVSSAALSFPDYSTNIGKEILGFLHGGKRYPAEVRHILFAANKWERRTKIDSLLARRAVTVVNRYTPSNLAYGMANGLGLPWLMNLEYGLPKADLVIILDAPPTELYNRRSSRKDRYEMSARVQESSREAYVKLARRFGWKVVDASLDVQGTHRQVVSAVTKTLSRRGFLRRRGAAP